MESNQQTDNLSAKIIKGPAGLLLISITGAVILIFIIFPLVRQFIIHKQVKESAQDILILRHAVEHASMNLGPRSMYPDYAFVSETSRRDFGLDTTLPQKEVDRLGNIGPDDPKIWEQLKGTKWENNIEYQLRLRRWEFFLWPHNQMKVSRRAIEENLNDVEVIASFHWEAEQRKKGIEQSPQSKVTKESIPHDPFVPSGEDSIYRYGRPPKTTLPNPIGSYDMWVIAGNGPDGDADLDVTKFVPVWTGPSKRPIKTDLGFGVDPIRLIYDPTNGIKSNGDIFIFSELPECDKALWDPEIFKKRYE